MRTNTALKLKDEAPPGGGGGKPPPGPPKKPGTLHVLSNSIGKKIELRKGKSIIEGRVIVAIDPASGTINDGFDDVLKYNWYNRPLSDAGQIWCWQWPGAAEPTDPKLFRPTHEFKD